MGIVVCALLCSEDKKNAFLSQKKNEEKTGKINKKKPSQSTAKNDDSINFQ